MKYVLPEDVGGIRDAVEAIKNDQHFKRQFVSASGVSSFEKMVEDGGTEIALQVFSMQMQSSGRQALLNRIWDQIPNSLSALVAEAMPQDQSDTVRRKEILKKCRRAIADTLKSATTEDELIDVSVALRELLDCSGKSFDELPREMRRKQTDNSEVVVWVTKQLNNWVNQKLKGDVNGYRCLGIDNETELSHFLSFLSEAVDVEAFAVWLRKYFGDLTTREDRLRARHFAAARLTNEIVSQTGDSNRKHHTAAEVQQRFKVFAEKELEHNASFKFSPHVHHVIEPFHKRLKEIATLTSPTTRPDLPGDEELRQIIERYSQRNAEL